MRPKKERDTNTSWCLRAARGRLCVTLWSFSLYLVCHLHLVGVPVGGYALPYGQMEGCLSSAVIVHSQEVLPIGLCIHCECFDGVIVLDTLFDVSHHVIVPHYFTNSKGNLLHLGHCVSLRCQALQRKESHHARQQESPRHS